MRVESFSHARRKLLPQVAAAYAQPGAAPSTTLRVVPLPRFAGEDAGRGLR